MKKLFKSVAVIASFAIATVAMAGSTNESTSYPTVMVTDATLSSSDWSSSATVNEGDQVSFMLHYYLNSGDSTSNMRFSMEDLTGRTFNAGQTKNVTGNVKGTGLTTANGSATINFADTVRLNLYNVSWQKGGCLSVGCETALVDGHTKVLTNGGMSIGSVDGFTGNNWQGTHYNGNVVVTFKAVAVTPVVTYDDCSINGITVPHGQTRTFYSATETSGQCSAIDQNRTCNDGTLSGSNAYKYATCSTVTVSDTDADVDTRSESSVDEDSATLNGYLDINDWNNAEVYFKWGTSSSNLNNTTSDVTRSSDGSFARGISNLNDDTTYYYRAYARNPSTGEIVFGNLESFRTDAEEDDSSNDDEDVTTRSPSNIDEDSARLNGEWEGEDNTTVWFAFSRTDSTPSCNSSSQEVGEQIADDNEDYSKTVTGLNENTKYYYRACAYDSEGDVIDGSIRSFVTDEEEDDNNNDDDVDVTTDSPSNIDEDSAKLNGEVEGDDNIEVWFALSATDTTPSCNLSSQKISVSGSYDDGDDFAKTVTGLNENTKYYYRACAEDNDGSVVSGSIRNFVTDDEDGESNPSSTDPSTVTNIASSIGTTSARLNSIVVGDGNATCYFQYGRTSSFGLVSPSTAIDLDNTSSCSSFRTGLASNSTYYYRSVLVQDGVRYYGSTRTFRTGSVPTTPVTPRPPVVTPTNPTPVDTNTTVTIVNRTETVATAGEALEVTKWVSAEDDARFDTQTEATAGETVFYKVRVENNSGEDLNNVVVIDRIPFYLELDNSSALNDNDDKQLRWEIDLEEGESRTFVTEMRVRDDAPRGEEIFSYASAEHDDYSANSNDVEIEVVAGQEAAAAQTANIFGSGFLPTTVSGWGMLILIVLAIAYFVSRIMVSRNENMKVLAELQAARNRA